MTNYRPIYESISKSQEILEDLKSGRETNIEKLLYLAHSKGPAYANEMTEWATRSGYNCPNNAQIKQAIQTYFNHIGNIKIPIDPDEIDIAVEKLNIITALLRDAENQENNSRRI